MAPGVATDETEVAELQKELATIYTPGKPIDHPDLFSGRPDLLADLRAEMSVDGVDFVLYGERGVGKTSLWRVLLHGKCVQRHSASATDDFVSIFLRVLASLGEQFTEDERTQLAEISSSIGTDKVASIGSRLSSEDSERPVADRKLDLNFVLDRLERRAGDLDAVVIDEFQNISKQAVQTQIIEVVKGFADRGVDVSSDRRTG
jgi:AAA+ ATPase superfamily predicted ATPase